MGRRAGTPPIAWAPIVLFVSLSSLLIGGWAFVQHAEQEMVRARLAMTARHVAVRLEQYLSAQIDRVAHLARRIEASGGVDAEEFRRLARAEQSGDRSFHALCWLDGDGVTRVVVPAEASRGEAVVDARNDPAASAAFGEAADSGRVTVTPPLELPEGGWGFASYARAQRDGRTLGFVNGVFRVETLLERCLDHPDDQQFGYVLQERDRSLGARGVGIDEWTSLPRAADGLTFAGREWRLSVVPTPQFAAAEETWTDEALLLLGIVLAAAMTWCAETSRARHRRVKVLADRFRVMIEHAPDAIVVFDAETGSFIDENENARRLFGRTHEEMKRIDFAELSPPRQPDGRDSREASAELVRLALAGEAPACEWVHVGSDGETIVTEMRLVRLPAQGRELVRGSITDITARRRLEERLHRAQTLEAMGRLAGGVAHDFNNVLTGIMGASELLAAQLAGDPKGQKLANEITDACARAADLTRQLLVFSRSDVVKPIPLDVNDAVDRLLPMLARTLGERVQIVTELDPRIDAVLIDASQFDLVLLNLAINGRDAMPSGGRLTVTTSMRDGADGGVRSVVLAVRDEGEGIAPENLARIFEPFFTTKTPNVGTGLGLATVKQVVRHAGGEIRVESERGHGSTFVIELPAVVDKARAIGEGRTAADVARGVGTVLLVEDDDAVRAVTRRALVRAGYEVFEARSGEDALRISGEHTGPIDLMLTDVVLPGVGGPELVSRLTAERPEIAILLMSGYSHHELSDTMSADDVELLRKPFTPSTLTRRVAEVLAARLST